VLKKGGILLSERLYPRPTGIKAQKLSLREVFVKFLKPKE
jgi:hypothetical protein